MNDNHMYMYRLIFEEWLKITDDGFIIIDPSGTVMDINENYCRFLETTKEEAIGNKIENIIPTTSMYDVIKRQVRGDGSSGFYIQPYRIKTDKGNEEKTYAIGNRFCVFDEEGQMVAAAAQLKFKQRAMNMASKIFMEEAAYYKEEYKSSLSNMGKFDRLIGDDPQLEELKKKACKIAKKDFPILITGETGTGKDLFARAIHAESYRRDKPLVCINCAAIPSNLLESELFGYEEGAFTGARRGGKIGKFQLADGGTIFLDEIGDMPLDLQAKLLRVLQEQEIERVGGTQMISIDVRIISATRRNLPKMMEKGTFREDLFYRLNVINLEMPPLRDRPDDILLTANYFLAKLNRRYKTKIILSDSVKRCMRRYSWPGNVRELNNVISSAYASCDNFIISATDFPTKIMSSKNSNVWMGDDHRGLGEIMDEYEAAMIREALHKNQNNVKKTAEDLKIDRSFLHKKMKRFDIVIEKIAN